MVFLLHFLRLSVGCLLLFGSYCFFVARPLMHKGTVAGTELLSHPFGAWPALGRGREGLRTGCAPRWLVAMEPAVMVRLADALTVLRLHSFHCTAPHHLLVLFHAQRSLGANAFRCTATDAPHLRSKRRASASHTTQRSTRHTQARSISLGHLHLQKCQQCNQNGEIYCRCVLRVFRC